MLLTIFYDGYCPLCVKEMEQLRSLDTSHQLKFENIYHSDFAQRYPEVDVAQANRILHGLSFDGQMLLGLDVTVRAWNLVGKKRWLKILRLPLIRWFADQTYLFFARNRYRISYWLTGQSRCESCEIGKRC